MLEQPFYSALPLSAAWFGRKLLASRNHLAAKIGGESDEAIVDFILSSKDPAPFTVIVSRYRMKLTALVRSTLAGTAISGEVDDIVQDAFVSAYDNLTSFRSEASFRPWIYKIAYNRCLDKLRRARRTVDSVDVQIYEDTGEGAFDTVVRNDQIRQINGAIELLPAHLKTIFLLRHMDNLSYADLAKVTGLPEGTVKTHLFRARSRVKSILQEGEPK